MPASGASGSLQRSLAAGIAVCHLRAGASRETDSAYDTTAFGAPWASSACDSTLISMGALPYTVVRPANVSNKLTNFGSNLSKSSAHAVQAALNRLQRSVSTLLFVSHNAAMDSWTLAAGYWN